LDVTTTYTLNEADKIRSRLASASMSETEKNYLNYYTRIYPKIEATDSITVTDNEAENTLTTTEHYQITDFFKKDTATAINSASFYANYISEQLPVVDNNVKYPVSLYYPYTIDYTIGVILPTGWNIETSSKEINRDAYQFSLNSSTVGDTLLLKYHFEYLQDFLPINKLDEYRGDVKKLKDDYLSFTFTYSPGSGEGSYRLNVAMLIAAIIVIILFVTACFKTYRTETHEVLFAYGANFIPLGGWLILVTAGLAITVPMIFFTIVSNNYFNLNSYNAHLLNSNNVSFKIFFVFEAFGNILLMCYACFCLILILNRRDILPKYIIGLYIFGIAFFIGDAIGGYIVLNRVSTTASTAIIRAIITAAVWIPYFKISSRVEQTFIVPYPATNYRYEEMEAGTTIKP
jgi:hypothetical protein